MRTKNHDGLGKRTLQLETLENRVMLSAVPATFSSVMPEGTQALCWTQDVELAAGETREFEFAVGDFTSVSALCLNHDARATEVEFGNSSSSISSNWLKSITVTEGSSTVLTLTNSSSSAGNYTLFVTSNCALETELKGAVTNDSFSSSVQPLTFTSVGTTAARQSVLLGQIGGTDASDCFYLQANGGKLNVQLYSMTGGKLSVEIYDASQNLLASSTAVDDFTSVLSSAAVTNARYFLKVKSSDPAVTTYSLTVTENLAVESDTAVESSLVNSLNGSGFGVGSVKGAAAAPSETVCQFEGEQIRSTTSDDSRMAVVTYVKNGSVYESATLHFMEFTGTQWKEAASVTYLAGNADGVDPETFGTALSISGDGILVGSSRNDSAIHFTRYGTELLAVKLTASPSAAGTGFGSAVLLADDLAFVSAVQSDVNGTDSGMIYVFKKTASSWSQLTTLSSGIAGSEFGSVLAWNPALSTLCVASRSASTLYFYQKTASGLTLFGSLDGSSLLNGSVTEFGRSLAVEGNSMAVSCKVDGFCRVCVLGWDAASKTWNLKTQFETEDARVTDFGTSLSFSGSLLAISSVLATNDDLENTGIVYLYQATVSEDGTQNWKKIQTFRHTEMGYYGKSVLLTRNRLDVFDSLQKKVYSLTGFADVDLWKLNVTEAGTLTLQLQASDSGGVLPKLEITAPDGSFLSVTPAYSLIGTGTDQRVAATYSFEAASVGTYVFSLYASDDAGTAYLLSVLDGSYGEFPDAGTVQVSSGISSEIVVEYAQQILVSSLADATAALGGTVLESPQILDGSKVVWSVPKNVANGTWNLEIAGLKSVAGTEFPVLNVSYEYSGFVYLNLKSMEGVTSEILYGAVSASLAAGDVLTIAIPKSGANLSDLDFQVSSTTDGMTLTCSEPVFDAEINCWLLNVSGSSAGQVTLEAALFADLAPGELEFQPISGNLGSLQSAVMVGMAEAGETQTIQVTLTAGQTADFALTDDAGNRLGFELYQNGTRLASGAVEGQEWNGQRISGLRNDSDESVTYEIKIANPSEKAVTYGVTAISGAVLESEGNDSLEDADWVSSSILGTVSDSETISLTNLGVSALTSAQLEQFGRKAAISGAYAAVAGNDFVATYHLEGGLWVLLQTLTSGQLGAGAIVTDLTLEGETLVVGLYGSVQIYALTSGASGVSAPSWSLSQTISKPAEDSSQAAGSFGYSVSLSGDFLLISDPLASDRNGFYANCGRVFLYAWDAKTEAWNYAQEIVSRTQPGIYGFGIEAAISGETMAIYAANSLNEDGNEVGLVSFWKCTSGNWEETACIQTSESASNFTNPQFQVSENRVVFCSSVTGNVYEYSYGKTDFKWSSNAVLETGIQITALSMNADASRLVISGSLSAGTCGIWEYERTDSGWSQAAFAASDSAASSLAVGEKNSLAVLAASSSQSVTPVQWNALSDCDYYRFVANAPSAQISLKQLDGTTFGGTAELLAEDGSAADASNLTVGSTYYVKVFPVKASSGQRYVLSVGAAQAFQPSAFCEPANDSTLNQSPESIRLTFSQNVDLSRLNGDEVLLTSDRQTVTTTGFRIINGRTVEFTLSEGTVLADDVWTVAIPAESLYSISGEEFVLLADENSVVSPTFKVDSVPANVTDVAFDAENGKITVTFSENISNCSVLFLGQNSGQIAFADASLEGSVLTAGLNFSQLVPDAYSLVVTRIQDEAGNVTKPEGSAGSWAYCVTQTEGESVEIESSAWLRAVLDGAFAYSTTITGYADENSPMRFHLDLADGEQISFRNPANGTAGVTAVWDAASRIVTVSANEGTAFELVVLRNSCVEVADADVTAVTLSDLITINEVTIRQTSVSGTMDSLTVPDVFRFTVSGRSSISASVTSLRAGALGLELYEELGDGKTLLIAASTQNFDAMDAWIQNAVNSSSQEKNYLLKVTASELPADGNCDYRLVISENALFNGATNGNSGTIVTLFDSNTAVGHVSKEVSGIFGTLARSALNGYSIAANDRYLFVGVPGDSSDETAAGKVFVYEFDGIRYQQTAALVASDTDAGDQFGVTLALDGETLAVSATNCVNSDGSIGAVYLFAVNGDGSFTQTQKVTNPGQSTDFGFVMDFADGILVTGTQQVNQKSYAFRIPENPDLEYATFPLSDSVLDLLNSSSGEWPYLGFSVAVDGGVIVLGAPMATQIQLPQEGGETANYETDGAFFIFRSVTNENGEEGLQLMSFTTSEEDDLRLGYSVAVENGIAVSTAQSVSTTDSSSLKSTTLYAIDLSGASAHTVLEGMQNSNFTGRELKFENGILTLAGDSGNCVALTMNSDGSWSILANSVSPNASSSGSSEITNKSFGFESAWANSTHFVSDPNALLGSLSSGLVYAFDQQNDYYRFTANAASISAAFTGLGAESIGNLSGRVQAVLVDANGSVITGSLVNGKYVFEVVPGSEYLLQVSVNSGSAYDYVLSVEGITQVSRTLELEELTLATPNGSGLAASSVLAGKPVSVTLSFPEGVREDRISAASVKISNGQETRNAASYQVASDGKSVTFTFDSSMVYYSTDAQIFVTVADFCTVSGSVLEVNGQTAEGIAAFQLSMESVSVSQKMKAAEEKVVLIWTFEEEVLVPASGWADAVSVTRTRLTGEGAAATEETQDVTAEGAFTYENRVLRWISTNVGLVQTDDSIKIELEASKVVSASGLSLEGLTQTEGGWVLAAAFTVNLDSAAQTEIVVRRESSLSSVNSETASLEEVPANEAWVQEWSTLWVEAWGWILSASENGLATYSAQISYNSKLFSPLGKDGSVNFSFNHSAFSSVTVTDHDSGNGTHVLTITASAARDDVGVCGDGTLNGHALIASIQFKPVTPGGVKAAWTESSGVVPSELGMAFVENSISITDSAGVTIEGNAEDLTENLPKVYPVTYDLNDDGKVEIQDLVRFARNFGKSNSYSEQAALCDFNASGSVEVMDLVFFARNFSKSMTEARFAESLTQNWGTVKLEPAAALAEAGNFADAGMEVLAIASNAILPETCVSTLEVAQSAPEMELSSVPSGMTDSGLVGTVGNVFWQDWNLLAGLAVADSTLKEDSALRAELLEEVLQSLGSKRTVSQTGSEDAGERDVWDFEEAGEGNALTDAELELVLNETLKTKNAF